MSSPDAPAPRVVPARRRPSPLLLTAVVLVFGFLLLSLFTGIWTEKLWFSSIGYSSVFSTLIWTRVGLFLVFGAAMALVVGVNLVIAYRFRPSFRPRTPDQANLDRYREVVTPLRRLLLVATSLVVGIFAGASATGQWRTFLLWRHRVFVGTEDPYFHKDVGFYFFTLPWWHYLVDFATTALVIGLLAALLVHYLYGGIRLTGADRFSGAAQAQISVLLGLVLLLKSVDYYLDRFDLNTTQGSLITGMTYAGQHARLPAKNILMFIAVICALVLFANVFRRTWLLPSVGVALLVLSSILLGVIWPAIVQNFQVNPSQGDKEQRYIAQNIKATRAAYDVAHSTVTDIDPKSNVSQAQLDVSQSALQGVRLVDPQLVSPTFQQLQQVRGYYSVPKVLDVDRYDVDKTERDLVVAARELNLDGLPDAQKNWNNEHTVYTHGYGLIAAYGNQRDAADNVVLSDDGQPDGKPVWAEKDLPPTGVLGKYVPQIYYGEQSPSYSIVGRAANKPSIELDRPQSSGSGAAVTNTYDGPGVSVGSMFHKLLYAMKFGDTNILLSSRVHSDSKILYDRSPKQRVQKVAPWLTVDSDALPAVVDGRIVWILDGYTTSNRYPLSQQRSFKDMVSDSLNPRAAFATLPTDRVNYIRNAVKATVDAYTGKVTLYGWDESDPLLKAWSAAFPGVVKPRASIPPELLAHFRYPEDLYKVQRSILAEYHVTNAKTFYEGSDQWQVPQDPEASTRKQPPYRLSVSTQADQPTRFSLTSLFVPNKRQNLAAFMTVGSDATDASTYGKIKILRLPDDRQIAGPSQISNTFNAADNVATKLRSYTLSANASVEYGNLLTVPVGGGLLYVQPLYTKRGSSAAAYPQLTFVVASFGDNVGIGATLQGALNDLEGSGSSTGAGDSTGSGGTGSLNAEARDLLRQANEKFQEADAALKKGDLEGYAAAVKEAQDLVKRALDAATATPKSGDKPGSKPSGKASASASASSGSGG